MGAEKARFPTVKSLEKYRKLAKATGGKLTQGGTNLVNMVWNDSAKPTSVTTLQRFNRSLA